MDPNQNPFQNEMPPVNLSYPTNRGRRMAIASLIFGISTFLFLIAGNLWFVFAAITLAIVFSCVSRKQAGKWSGIAIAGLALGLLALILVAVLIGFGIYIAMEAMKDPDGEIAKLLDQYFLQQTGKSFSEWIKMYQ